MAEIINLQDSATVRWTKGAQSGTDSATGYPIFPVNARALNLRTIGLTIDGSGSAITTGVKGSVQVRFSGTIVGWSIVADQSGSISIQIEKHAGTETVPVVPTADIDKISASAPIALDSAQAAGAGSSGVATWTTSVAKWDSVQFNVKSATTVTRVTAYLAIQES